MGTRISGDFTTITVTGSSAVATADGRYAIALTTVEAGTIAFEVNQVAIRALRESLAKIEQLQSLTPGKA